jgi:hypothetical protein
MPNVVMRTVVAQTAEKSFVVHDSWMLLRRKRADGHIADGQTGDGETDLFFVVEKSHDGEDEVDQVQHGRDDLGPML